jgi:RHS repeat-associated protein
MRFHSSEATNQSDRPYLEVVYSTEATTSTVYFLKDHLGSICATVLDSIGAPVIGYDDYDPWGYALAQRTKPIPNAYLQGGSKNKFTEKEWDDEYGLNLYHFGWRPYDPQIGRWVVMDPLAEKYPGWSPYVYTLDNPIQFVDPNGKEPTRTRIFTATFVQSFLARIQSNGIDILRGANPFTGSGNPFRGVDKNVYVPTKSGRYIDMKHFMAHAALTFSEKGPRTEDSFGKVAFGFSLAAGVINEVLQKIFGLTPNQRASAFSNEDIPSNLLGASFGLQFDPNKPLADQIFEFLKGQGAILTDEELEEFKKSEAFQQLPKDEADIRRRQLEREREERERMLDEYIQRSLYQ